MGTDLLVKPRKTEIVKGAILKHITESGLSPGMRILGEHDWTRKLGVSRNTVRDAVETLVQEGVLVRRKGAGTYLGKKAGFTPEPVRRTAIDTLRIGFVIFNAEQLNHVDPFIHHILKGLSEPTDLVPNIEITMLGSAPAFRNYGGLHFLEAAKSGRVDGLLITVAEGISAEDLREVSKSGVSVVGMNYGTPFKDYPSVRTNLNEGVQQAVQLLYKAGHQRVGMLMGVPPAEIFLSGYTVGHTLTGRECNLNRVAYTYRDVHRFAEAIEQLRDQRVDAIICYDDDAAVELIRYLKRHKIRVPEDIAVVGVNDTADPNSKDYPPLTTLRMPMEEMGRSCRDLFVMSRMGQDNSARTISLHPELIIRKSALANPKTT